MGLSPAKISIASQPPRAVIRIVGRAAVGATAFVVAPFLVLVAMAVP
jgi:hypothetical protein